MSQWVWANSTTLPNYASVLAVSDNAGSNTAFQHAVFSGEWRLHNNQTHTFGDIEAQQWMHLATVFDSGSARQYLEDHSFSPEQIVEKQNYESVNHTALMKNISGLDRRAQDIIRARWLDDHKLTLNELADKYSVSAERIRQIEASAFKKLKTSLVNV